MTASSLPERLGRLGLGTADLGNLFQAMPDADASALLEAAWQAGIRHFDTAPHYGLGLSERRLGEFLRTKPRDAYVLSTKAGRLLRPDPGWDGGMDVENDFVVPADLTRVWDAGRDGIRRSLDESLDRLGLDQVDVLYLHDPEKHGLEASLETAVPALVELRDEGAVGAVGVGSMSTAALTAAATAGGLDLLMVAGRHTLLERSALAEVFPAARAAGTRIVAASVFNSGLLSGATPSPDARYEYGAVPPEVWDRAVRIAEVCAAHGVELATAALHYPLRDELVVSVVVGAARPEQIAQNAARMATPVPDELWDELTALGLIPA